MKRPVKNSGFIHNGLFDYVLYSNALEKYIKFIETGKDDIHLTCHKCGISTLTTTCYNCGEELERISGR